MYLYYVLFRRIYCLRNVKLITYYFMRLNIESKIDHFSFRTRELHLENKNIGVLLI